jgi:hypothetical protein
MYSEKDRNKLETVMQLIKSVVVLTDRTVLLNIENSINYELKK